MSYGRAYKDHPQIEKALLLSTRKGLRLLNNNSAIIIHSAHLCKIKAQFENIILSLCRATNKIYSILIHKIAHVTVNKHLLFCDVIVVIWTITE